MIRNIVDNVREHNINEATDLLSYSLFLYVFIYGVIPSILVSLITIIHDKPLKSYINRGIFIAGIFLIAASTFILNYKFYTFFYRQNEDTLVYINPVYPLVAVKKYVKRQMKNNYVFKEIGDDAYQKKDNPRKTVGIMVVGETARADRFSLNGYQRQTNPILSMDPNIINFKNVHSCGTSTAYSVPCMFSFLNQDDYSPEKAQQFSNVLDILKKSNIKVTWGENNSSCKGVCKRIVEVNFINNLDKYTKSESNGQNYDEIMLQEFNNVINNTDEDVLFVLHSMGSHGPKYHNRYPYSDSVFRPYCQKSTPQECNREEINNAYDNTIIYTDYFLGLIINYLKEHESDYNSFMLYASDHGESLGENGIYLHGLPYILAPEAQTHIPMLMWLSDDFITDNNLNLEQLKQQTNIEYSHDNIVHTLLGLFDVQTSLYNQKLDIIHTAHTK